MEEIGKKKEYYPIPATEFEIKGRYVPSYLPSGPVPLSENIYVAPLGTNVKESYLKKLAQKIKKYLHNMSLKTAFSIYVTQYILTAVILSSLIVLLLIIVRDYISSEQSLSLLLIISIIIIGTIFIAAILIAGLRFYQRRLEPPLSLLREASEKISSKDYSFSTIYSRDDELGKLCESFEVMRATLELTYSELLRQIDERKRLNSVFSHDLRTPLTVLKGNVVLLGDYLKAENIKDEKITDSLTTMNSHISRLENYVDIMSKLQKLDDIEIRRNEVNKEKFVDLLRSTATIMCEEYTLRFYDDIPKDSLFVDSEIILTVIENLISNAARYAKKVITIVCSYSNNCFIISVSDDGEGFSAEGLLLATNPFYKEKKNVFDTHFGLGLNISKTLTVKHGGNLSLENISAGGALVRAEFSEIS